MAKTIPAALESHLAQEVTTLTTIWEITRADGQIVRLTEHDRNLVVDGDTYTATFGYMRSAISSGSGFTADDIEIDGLVDSGFISEDDISAGVYNGADLRISLVNWADTSQGAVKLKRGRIGEIISNGKGQYNVEFTSLLSLLDQKILEAASASCRAELGDKRCKFPIQPPIRENSTAYELGDFVRVSTGAGDTQSQFENSVYECTTAGTTAASPPTFTSVTTDGTVEWTARDAFVRHATVGFVLSQKAFLVNIDDQQLGSDSWFVLGRAVFDTGENAGETYEIKNWTSSGSQVELFLPARKPIAFGDELHLIPGCDKRRLTCWAKFNIPGSKDFDRGNVANFRGEPDLPGRDAVIDYPDAQ